MIDGMRAGSPSRGSLTKRVARVAGLSAMITGAVVAIAACGASSSAHTTAVSSGARTANLVTNEYGTTVWGYLPSAGTPVHGGTLTQGQLTGQTPTYIMPIAPGANTSTGTVSMLSELYMPLYAGPTGAIPKVDYALSLAAGPPKPSNGGKTYTIPLKTGIKWSNGTPVTANDVLFWYYILKAAVTESPANWGQFVPGEFPTDVTSASAPNSHTVVFHLNKAYNPGFFLNNQMADTNNTYAMPSTAWNIEATGGPHMTNWTDPKVAKAIYDYLNKQGAAVASFGTNPLWQVNDGPFKLKSFSATNSSYVLVPNPDYGGSPKPMFDELDVNTYTSYSAELNALRSGSLDFAVGLDPSQIPQATSLHSQGVDMYGGPSWGWFGGIINFQDTTNHFDKVIGQPYVRAAIDYLINQPAIIKGVYKGAAVEAYGPTPTSPSSPYAPADAAKAPYPFSPSKAVALLKSHGWKVVPGGQTTCEKAGSGAGECGAGIPAGTPLAFSWANQPESVSSVGALESEVLQSQAKQSAGINISLQTKTFNFLTSDYNDQNPGAKKYTNDWGVNNYGGLFMDYYPTQDGVFNPGSGFNLGAYNDAQANKLINNSVFGGNASAVKAEASYLEHSLPVFFFPDQDYLLGVNTHKLGSSPDGYLAPTQQQWFPQFWYAVK